MIGVLVRRCDKAVMLRVPLAIQAVNKEVSGHSGGQVRDDEVLRLAEAESRRLKEFFLMHKKNPQQ